MASPEMHLFDADNPIWGGSGIRVCVTTRISTDHTEKLF